MDIDEHGFIASGALMARAGLLPYRDYHYNHMPTEVFVYAALFRMTDHLLLAARLFQAFCAACIATAIFATTLRASGTSDRGRLLFSWAMGLLLLTNQVFTRTAGISWNHDFPLLMALLSFLALARGLRGRHDIVMIALAGFLIGVSATTRLTFLPLIAPLGLFILLYPRMSWTRRLALAAIFSAGFAIACLPSLWVWSKAWENAFFGNFLYPRLNTKIHELHDTQTTTTFWRIILYYLERCVTLPTLGVLVIMFILLMAQRLRRADWRDRGTWEILTIVGIVGICTVAGFLPRPPYVQYIYATVPFMVLAIAMTLPQRPPRRTEARWLAAGSIFSILFGATAYWHIVLLPVPWRWVPMRAHAEGLQVMRELPPGLVLTIEPLFPLEGGGRIDPRFAVGRFAPRVADLMTPAQRRQYLMPGLGDMAAVFDEDSPGSVLIMAGSDGRVQDKMIAEALGRGYQPKVLSVGWEKKQQSGEEKKRPLGEAWVQVQR